VSARRRWPSGLASARLRTVQFRLPRGGMIPLAALLCGIKKHVTRSGAQADRRTGWFIGRLAFIALAAALVRVMLVVAIRDHHAFGYDATWYHTVANRIVEGDGYTAVCPLIPSCVPRATAYFPPMYPLMLSVASRIGAQSVFAHQLYSCLFGTTTIVLLGLLGRELAGPRVGLLAALLGCIYPVLIGADAAVMAESLYAMLITAALYCCYVALARPRILRWALLGLLLGLAALTRGEGLALAVLLIPLSFAARSVTRTRRALFATVATATLVLPFAPWLVRNHLTFSGTPQLSYNFSALIRGANCDSAYHGARQASWDIMCLSEEQGTGPHAEAKFHSKILRIGVDYARSHAAEVPKVALLRVGRTWGVYRPVQSVRFEEDEGRHFPVQLAGWLMYLTLLPAAVGGFVLLRRRKVRIWPLAAPAIAVTAVSALTYGNQRFRIAAEPSLLVTASVFIHFALRRLARGLGAVRGADEV
jgi:4-amino-4-deoxy-L-arabinose transferase-like glycosyltransferase